MEKKEDKLLSSSSSSSTQPGVQGSHVEEGASESESSKETATNTVNQPAVGGASSAAAPVVAVGEQNNMQAQAEPQAKTTPATSQQPASTLRIARISSSLTPAASFQLLSSYQALLQRFETLSVQQMETIMRQQKTISNLRKQLEQLITMHLVRDLVAQSATASPSSSEEEITVVAAASTKREKESAEKNTGAEREQRGDKPKQEGGNFESGVGDVDQEMDDDDDDCDVPGI